MKTNIKEVEEATGISRQNIRYYEKQGLVCPARNAENDYREYTKEDIERLQKIKLFRKLGMPIEELRKLLDGEVLLEDALSTLRSTLLEEQKALKDAIEFCGEIREKDMEDLDASFYLNKMEERERSGSVFAEFMNDFQAVVKAEGERYFSFSPDNACMNKEEFTESLFAYANENNLNIVITKEGMYPEFTLDGVEYRAERVFGRYGATVHCEMVHPELAMPKGMSEKRYKRMKIINFILPFVLIFAYIAICYHEQITSVGDFLILALLFIVLTLPYYIYFHNYR